MRPALLATVLAAPLLACDPLFFVEIEERRICFEQTHVIPAAPPVGDQTVTWQDTLDLSDGIPGLDEGAIEGDLRILEARIRGTTSLETVSSAGFTLHATGSVPVAIASYARPAVVTDPNVLAFAGSPQVNLLDFLDDTLIVYRVDLAGSPPTTAWDGAVEICLSMKVNVDLLGVAREEGGL